MLGAGHSVMAAGVQGRRFSPMIFGPALSFDASNSVRMFQDTLGATPAAPSGDPVRRILVGGGHTAYLTAPADANRATYLSGSGRYWLDGDGNDDFYTADTRFGLSADPDLTVIAAINTGDQMSAIERIWHIGEATAGSICGAVGSDGPSWRYNNGNRKFPAIANNTDSVIAWRRSAGDPYGNGQVFVDGVEQIQTSVTNPGVVPSDTGGKFSMFAQPNATEWFGGRIYAILVFSRWLKDAELMRATSWMGAKQGRLL